MIYTTLNRIWAHCPCEDGWEMLLRGLGKTQADDEPLSFERIVEINGISDALWFARAEPQHAQVWQLFAVWCARRAAHLADDPASTAALLDVAERHALGQATDQELAAAAQAPEAPTLAAQAAYWAAADAASALCQAAASAPDKAYTAERAAQTEEFLNRLRDHGTHCER